MIDIKKYKKEIKRRRNNNDYSFSGITGHCFIEGDNIIKIYDFPIYKDDICDLSLFSSSMISFPLEYIKKRKFYYGEVLPYFNKLNIMNGINSDCFIDKIITDYHIMVNEIEKFPYLMMYDISYPNILYGEDGFSLIDVTNWKYDPIKYSKVDSFRFNLADFNDSLLYCFWKKCTDLDVDQFWIKKYLGNEFNDVYLNCIRGLVKIDQLMEIYLNIIKKYDFEVKNIADMQESVKILKKNIDFSR